ncbi:excinuclease ABC subunit B [bacterium]|nr:MAG: excinuclease ABC subunit B [bacterium]
MDGNCKICGARAVRRFTEIVGGRKRSMPLCQHCADAQETQTSVPKPSAKPPVQVKLHAKLIAQGLPTSTLRCPECGMRVVDLRKTGRLGCAKCYEVFRKQVMPLLKRIHGATEHEGARPMAGVRVDELSQLRVELRRAIEAEDFEQAARLRDRIGAGGANKAAESGEDHE